MGVLRTEVKSLHTCKIDRNAFLFCRSKANPYRSDCLLSCQKISCNIARTAFSTACANNTKNEDKLWPVHYIRPVASFFFGGAIQGGDGVNETGDSKSLEEETRLSKAVLRAL